DKCYMQLLKRREKPSLASLSLASPSLCKPKRSRDEEATDDSLCQTHNSRYLDNGNTDEKTEQKHVWKSPPHTYRCRSRALPGIRGGQTCLDVTAPPNNALASWSPESCSLNRSQMKLQTHQSGTPDPAPLHLGPYGSAMPIILAILSL
ncbi:hypothetical protein STEG23_018852, partial [Scotinomys teguina]